MAFCREKKNEEKEGEIKGQRVEISESFRFGERGYKT